MTFKSQTKIEDVPKPQTNGNNQFDVNNNNGSLTKEQILMLPYDYLLQNPGKRVRTELIKAFNYWLDVPDKHMEYITEIIEMLHNASLLIDDIEDNSSVRRGKPAAHKIFGVPSALNCGNYMYCKSLEVLLNNAPEESFTDCFRCFTKRMLQLHRGQGMDIYWRDTVTCPSLQDYLEMIENKTTGLFGLALDLMRQFSSNKTDYSPLVRKMGEYFQIRDDYANLKFDEYAESKTFGEDLTEGKFSYPVIHAITNFPQDSTIITILRQRTADVNIKKFAIQHLDKLGSLDVASKKLIELRDEIMADIENFGGNPGLNNLMQLLYLDDSELKRLEKSFEAESNA